MAQPKRLIYGFLSQSTDAFNISIPWRPSERDGLFRMNYSLEESVTDNLISWAKTNWGERVYRFRYGLDAGRYIFEPIPIMREALLQNAKEQLRRYFSFLEIDNLQIVTSEDDRSLDDNQAVFVLEAHFKDNEERRVKVSTEVGR